VNRVLTTVLLLVLSALTLGVSPAGATPTGVPVTGPWAVTVNPAADTAYVVSRSSNSLRAVTGDGTPGASTGVGGFPLGAAYNPVNGYVYTANYSGASVSVVNPVTMSVVTTVSTTALGAVGSNPYWVAVDESTGDVVVSFYSAGGRIGVIDPATHALTSLALPAGQTGDSHVGATVDPVHHVAYVADATAGLVDVVPLSGATPSTVAVGGSPAGLAYADGTVYVGFASGTTLKVIDTEHGNAVSSVAVGNTPSGVAVAPGSDAVFTTNNGDGTLSVVDGRSLTTVTTITPGATNDYLTWPAVDETHGRLYIGDFTAGRVFIAAPADTAVAPTLALSPSVTTAQAGDSVTWTATPSTGTEPVTFYDTTTGSTPLPGCTDVPVSDGSATCSATYPAAGSFDVTARSAERMFLYEAASSAPGTVTVTAPPAPPTVPTPTPTSTPAPAPVPTPTAEPTPAAPALRGPRARPVPTGEVGTPYAGRLTAAGGVRPYAFAVTAGSLPPGLALTATGRIHGRPTRSGARTVTVEVTDAAGTTSQRAITVDVRRATAASLPAIDRAGQITLTTRPTRYDGAERRTTFWRATAGGVDAYPVHRLRGRDLTRGQAATLSGDGLFAFDSARLTTAGRAQVRALAAVLRERARAVRCEGYTDYAGSRRHEVALSRQRAAAVCSALVRLRAGVRTSALGYGPDRPAVVGGSATDRRENRRVVVLVTR
jgi:outer membrane protein OmpA-like peptidoglycan-associated protein/DNA-binding beta-propeller fold protein YncE